MVIANPIYDVVFKQLMQETRIAKFFIETLIEETIEELEPKPQEFKRKWEVKDEIDPEILKTFTVYRLDYIATIKTASGAYKKVLIEVQKARNSIDVSRFRNYLADQYKLEDEVDTPQGRQKKALPIITIYLLGFKLANIPSAAVKISRNYFDLISRTVIDTPNEFIEQLTHDTYVVQMERIDSKLNTRLEQLLSIFEQRYFLDGKGVIKDYTHQPEDPHVKKMLDILHYAGSTPEGRKDIEEEIELWRTIEGGNRNQFLAMNDKIIEQEQEIERVKKLKEEQEHVILEQMNTSKNQADLVKKLAEEIAALKRNQ